MAAPSDRRGLLLFLHGLGGSGAGTWGSFRQLIDHDPEIDFDVRFLDQPSSLWRRPFGPVSARIEELAKALGTEIDLLCRDYDDIVLVTHSMGGLVAREWLVKAARRGAPVKVRGMVFFAVPHEGAHVARIGNWFSSGHWQLRQLAPGSHFIAALNQGWTDARCSDLVDTWNVVGTGDGVVPASSGAPHWLGGMQGAAAGKTHRDVVKPASRQDLAFVVVRAAALQAAARGLSRQADDRGPPDPETAAADGGNPLFYVYTAADEPYYVARAIDDAAERLIRVRNLWLCGPPGCGKSVCAKRVVMRAFGRSALVSLGSAAGAPISGVLETAAEQIARQSGTPPQQAGGDQVRGMVELLNAARLSGLEAIVIEEIPLGDPDVAAAFFAAMRAVVVRHAVEAVGVPIRLLFTSGVDPADAFQGDNVGGECVKVLSMSAWKRHDLDRLLQIASTGLELPLEEREAEALLRRDGVTPRFVKMFLINLLELGAGPNEVAEAMRRTSLSMADPS